MITEDYVSFETAKLLKDKGFDEKCRALYTFWFDEEVEGPKEDRAENWNVEQRYFSAPTIQMAMKWLRKEYKLYVTAIPNGLGQEIFYPGIYKRFEFGWNLLESSLGGFQNAEFNSPEEACEAAIRYTLENLI